MIGLHLRDIPEGLGVARVNEDGGVPLLEDRKRLVIHRIADAATEILSDVRLHLYKFHTVTSGGEKLLYLLFIRYVGVRLKLLQRAEGVEVYFIIITLRVKGVKILCYAVIHMRSE